MSRFEAIALVLEPSYTLDIYCGGNDYVKDSKAALSVLGFTPEEIEEH